MKAASRRRDRRCRLALSVASDKGLRDCCFLQRCRECRPRYPAKTHYVLQKRKITHHVVQIRNKKRNVYVEKRTTFQGGSDRKFHTATNKNHQQKTRLNIRDWFISPLSGVGERRKTATARFLPICPCLKRNLLNAGCSLFPQGARERNITPCNEVYLPFPLGDAG